MKTKSLFSKLSVFLIVVIVLSTCYNLRLWTNEKKIIYWDGISYYAYLPATFIYKDIGLSFMKDKNIKSDGKVYSVLNGKKFVFWPLETPTGKYCIKTTMGLSILYLPFFLIGHIYNIYIGNYNTGGFSEPYKIALIIGTIFWFMLGLIWLRKLLLKFFDDKVTAITLLIIGLGTNLSYYVVFEPVMSHMFNFTLFTLFILQTINWYENKTIKKSIFIGLTIGLISLIRPTDIVISLVFIFYGINNLNKIKYRFIEFYHNFHYLLVIIFSAFVIWLPQFIYWKYVSGHYLFYSYANNEHFFWNNPHIIEGIFGYRKGWLIYTPVMVFSLIGIFFLKNRLKNFISPVIIFLGVNFYIIFSWWAWWYGGSFGMRAMIESYSLLSIPLAAFIALIIKQKKVIKIPMLIFVTIFALYNIFATIQYYNGAIHWDGMTKEAYWDSFGKLHPSQKFWSLVKSPDYEAAKKGIDK